MRAGRDDKGVWYNQAIPFEKMIQVNADKGEGKKIFSKSEVFPEEKMVHEKILH